MDTTLIVIIMMCMSIGWALYLFAKNQSLHYKIGGLEMTIRKMKQSENKNNQEQQMHACDKQGYAPENKKQNPGHNYCNTHICNYYHIVPHPDINPTVDRCQDGI